MEQRSEKLRIRVTHRYDDIIHQEYPLKQTDVRKHPRMNLDDRAKIFAPFAALKGYEDAIAAKQKIVVPKIELSEESKEYLDAQLVRIAQLLDKKVHPVITVVYFQKKKEGIREGDGEDQGEYIQFTGMVAKFHPTSRILQIVEKRLSLDDIYDITGDELE